MNTHLTRVQWWVIWVGCEQEHVYEVDQYAGGHSGLIGSVNDPFEDHQEHEVAEETQHEEQLRDQHEEYAAGFAKVPAETQELKGDMWRWQESKTVGVVEKRPHKKRKKKSNFATDQ